MTFLHAHINVGWEKINGMGNKVFFMVLKVHEIYTF